MTNVENITNVTKPDKCDYIFQNVTNITYMTKTDEYDKT